MNFPINFISSSELFKASCQQLSHFGQAGYERVAITPTPNGNLPVACRPNWIDRILSFFGFKRRALRLNEVANFSLNWLRLHATDYHQEFYTQLPAIKALRPLMKKAELENAFDSLVSSVEKTYITKQNVTQFYEDIAANFEEKVAKPLTNRIDSVHELCQKLEPLKQRAQIFDSFQLHWPDNFPNSGEIEQKIKQIISRFLLHPGTTIHRQKKTSNITLSTPGLAPTTYTLPVKVDFYLEGAIDQRRIIVKTKELVGAGGQRKVLKAFDLLSREQLVSKPYASAPEKMIVGKQLPGLVPCIGVREKRFYELRCESLHSFFKASPEIRWQIALQLSMALAHLHSLIIPPGGLTYSIKRDQDQVIKQLPPVLIYHGDIKPSNILAQGKTNQFFLSDLGSLCDVVKCAFTMFFRSPEKTRFIETKCFFFGEPSPFLDSQDIIEHNLSFGQSNDVWSLGVVFATLLSGGLTLQNTPEEAAIPDLLCFQKCLTQHKQDVERQQRINPDKRPPSPDDYIQNITQAEIDRSLDELFTRSNSPKELRPLLDLVKKMLQVDPKNRITALNAYKFLESIRPFNR